MAGTIIDSLVVELGLDPRNMTSGAKTAVDNLRNMEAAAEKAGVKIGESADSAADFFKRAKVKESGKEAADAFKDTADAADKAGAKISEAGETASEFFENADLEKGGKDASAAIKKTAEHATKSGNEMSDAGGKAGDYFDKTRKQALALFAVFTAGRGIKAFVGDTVSANAQLGYMAQRLQIAPSRLFAMGKSLQEVGGDANEFTNSMVDVQQRMATPEGRAQEMRVLRQLGVDDQVGPNGQISSDILQKINERTQGMNQAQRNTLMSMAGFGGTGEINLVNQTPAQFQEMQKRNQSLAPTTQEIAQEQQLVKDWNDLKNESEAAGRSILTNFEPAIHAILTDVTALEKAHPDVLAGVGVAILGIIGIAGGLKTLGLIRTIANVGKLAAALEALNVTLNQSAKSAGTAAAAEEAENLAGGGKSGVVKEAETLAEEAAPGVARKGLFARALPWIGRALPWAGRATGIGVAAYELLHADPTNSNEGAALDKLRTDKRLNSGVAFQKTGVPYKSGSILQQLGVTQEQFDTAKQSVASIEGAGYGQMGGSSGRFAGRYQMGSDEIKEAAASLGEKAPSRQQFLTDPKMQERYFEAYTASHDKYLMKHSEAYRAMTGEQKLEVLGYAHNQGAGGAAKWLATGQSQRDGFGTDATRYANLIRRQEAALSQKSDTQVASAAPTVASSPPPVAQPSPPATSPAASAPAAAAPAPSPTINVAAQQQQLLDHVKAVTASVAAANQAQASSVTNANTTNNVTHNHGDVNVTTTGTNGPQIARDVNSAMRQQLASLSSTGPL